MERRKSKSAILLDNNISYQTLPSYEDQSRNHQKHQRRDIIRQHGDGLALAETECVPIENPAEEKENSNESVDLISNAGVLEVPDGSDIPNEYEFEINRLHHRVEELECIVRDRNDRVVAAIAMLQDELTMWSTLLHDHVTETHGGIQRRIIRIESTIDRLREKGAKFYPPQAVPERWQK